MPLLLGALLNNRLYLNCKKWCVNSTPIYSSPHLRCHNILIYNGVATTPSIKCKHTLIIDAKLCNRVNRDDLQ